ncbi:MAG: xylulokinase [Planctomycetota bacterium]|jgi:xylulokinase
MGDLLLGLDIGTTGAKALLVDPGGEVVAEAFSEYPLDTPQPLWAEQDPADWWRAAAGAIRRVLEETPGSVAAVGLTGQMHGLVLLDARGDVLRPAILWNDQRTGAECKKIRAHVGDERVLELTGNAVLPGFTAPKIAWVRAHEPDVFARIAHVLLPKDLVRHRLTGEHLGDVSDASGTCLFDVGARRWSDEMSEAVGVRREWLPEVTESTAASARVSAEAARATGLPEGTPVVAGAGDQAAQAVGAGLVEEGTVGVTIGTSGVVFAPSSRFRVEPEGRLHAFCHAVPDRWHVMGVMLSAGGSLRWYRDTLRPGERYEELMEEAEGVAPGADGLLFLPYLTGERTPHPDPLARGAFVGLTVRHGRANLTRAVLEGVTFGLADSLSLIRDLGLPVERARASGGGAKSALWRRMIADVLDVTVETVAVAQGAAYGAALLAGVGAGLFASVESACAEAVRVTETVRPGPAAEIYRELRPRYRALYPLLREEFRRM